jgi:hypothetical protein
MAMSTRAADTEYLVRKAAKTGYQFASLLIPPVYTAFILARRGRSALSVNRLLRATWVGGLGGRFHIVSHPSLMLILGTLRWPDMWWVSLWLVCSFKRGIRED